jgi:hypothetical protein
MKKINESLFRYASKGIFRKTGRKIPVWKITADRLKKQATVIGRLKRYNFYDATSNFYNYGTKTYFTRDSSMHCRLTPAGGRSG